MRISEYFGLNKSQHELDFVDIDIDSDTPLFLDPYFIAKNDFPIAYEAHLSLKSYFACLLCALRENRMQDAEELFSHLGETNEICLGFSRTKPQGKGMGPSDASRIFKSLKESHALKTGIMEDIEDFRIFVDNVDRDKMSDMTANIIKKQLIEYTQGQCYMWGMPLTHDIPSGFYWEADQQDKFDCITAYVSPNLQLLSKINERYISKFLQTLEKHSNNKSYHSIVYNYAKGIEICHAFHTVANTLDDINSKAEYDLMHYLGSAWYRNNVAEANQEMKKLLEYPSDWSKKVAIDFIGFSLEYDKTAFEEFFSQIEKMLLQCDDLWTHIISVFVKYVLLFSKDSDTNYFYTQVLTHLRRLPKDSQQAKCCFLGAIQWEEELPNDIQEIFRSIILNPFETNQCPLDMLDFILYKQAKHGSFETVIKCMLDIFRVNKYHHRRTEFFEGLSSATGELSECSEKVTITALKYMLANDMDQMFFGLGWLMRCGNFQKLLQNTGNGIVHFTNAQLIRIMKTVLYFSVDGSKICNMAFQLLALLSDSTDNYIAFCMEELYENYPNTMFDVSKNYITSTVESQAQLAELVSNAHEKTRCEHEVISEINDLCPSWEHHYIYRKAMQKQNKQIGQNATKQSFLESFFKHQTLKYGARSAHVVQGSKGEKCYHSSPYQHFIHKMELPASYVDDPIGFEVKKTDFLSEVLSSAHDN